MNQKRCLLFSILTLAIVSATAGQPNSPAVPLKIVRAWTNAGHATAVAAFETAHWANMTNKPDVSVESVAFTEEDTAIFQEIFDALPADRRATFKTPRRMAATVIASFARRPVPGKMPPTGFEVLAETVQSADEVLLTYRFYNDARTSTQIMRRFETGWKLLVPSTQLQDPRRRKVFEAAAKSAASESHN